MGFFRERSSAFSLEFLAIRPSVSGKARSKVAPLRMGTSFEEFRQTPEGRGLLLLGLFFSLRVLLMVWVV